jgi:hypothetical protein
VATGFQFDPGNVAALVTALERAFALYADRPAWQATQQRAMTRKVDWSVPAKAYAALYRDLVEARRAAAGPDAAEQARDASAGVTVAIQSAGGRAGRERSSEALPGAYGAALSASAPEDEQPAPASVPAVLDGAPLARQRDDHRQAPERPPDAASDAQAAGGENALEQAPEVDITVPQIPRP